MARPISWPGGVGADPLLGGEGADTRDGGTGDDSLNGGAGEDSDLIDSLSDLISEAPGGGIDTVISAVCHALAADFENLTLSGTSSLTATAMPRPTASPAMAWPTRSGGGGRRQPHRGGRQ